MKTFFFLADLYEMKLNEVNVTLTSLYIGAALAMVLIINCDYNKNLIISATCTDIGIVMISLIVISNLYTLIKSDFNQS